MKPIISILTRIISNRWFAVGLILAAGLLLSLVAVTFGDTSVPLPGLHAKPEPIDRIVPVNRIEKLSAKLNQPPGLPLANGNHPFFTLFFKPSPKIEPVPPTPPPPASKKVMVLYQGVYRTAGGSDKAFVKVENELVVLSPGGSVLNDWSIHEISPQKLTLTNRTAETTILEFNREKTLEVRELKP